MTKYPNTSGASFVQLLGMFEPQTIRYNRRVFINRNLRLDGISHVGFDMDYTLALYQQSLDELSWGLILDVLTRESSYPKEILSFDYDPGFAIRGLAIDLPRGNVFKLDKYRHVGRACHGTRVLDHEERVRLYRQYPINPSRRSFHLMDTLFSLPEACLFARMVDFMDGLSGKRTQKEYVRAFRAIRSATDRIHRDGSLKSRVLDDIGGFIARDPELASTLEQFKASGKKLFLLTNSGWNYTNGILSWLLNDELPSYPHWTDYFNMVVVNARKPGFFSDKEPLVALPAGENVFSGGNINAIEEFLGGSGDEVLYVGDHIYGDIVKSKKTSTWRTAMIIPEMEEELKSLEKVREDQKKADRLFESRVRHEIEINYQQRLMISMLNALEQGNGDTATRDLEMSRAACEAKLNEILAELGEIDEQERMTEQTVMAHFNPIWGMLFKEGNERSVFGAQVEDYACVYTGKVSNFLSYSPTQYLRNARDLLPHELVL